MDAQPVRDNQLKKAPYLPFKNFRSAVQHLREQGLTPTLLRTWENRTWTERSEILGALKFLGLINDRGQPQESLTQLVGLTPNSDEERSFLASLLRSQYEKVFELDLLNETPQRLEEVIGEYGVSGKVRERAVRFFLKAALYTEIPVSALLTAKMRESSQSEGSNGKPHRRRKSLEAAHSASHASSADSSAAMKTIHLPKVGGLLSVAGNFNAFQLVGEERDLVYKIIDLMTAYEGRNGADERIPLTSFVHDNR